MVTLEAQIGPRLWIPAQVFVFGLVATLQIFVVNRNGFLVSRLMLGLAEAGYIPGALYTLSMWYSKRELAKRVAIFFFGMFGGNAISPLLASGILQLDSVRGLRGWQWLFLSTYSSAPRTHRTTGLKNANTLPVEGLFTICISAFLFLLLPGSPSEPKPLVGPGIIRFSKDDELILRKRFEMRDGQAETPNDQRLLIDWKLVWKTVSHYRRWPHFVSTFAVFSTWSPLTTYTPSIIM